MSNLKINLPGRQPSLGNFNFSNINSNEKLPQNVGNMNNYFANPFLMYDDINENIRNTIRKEIGAPNNDFSLSLERAYLPLEIENIHGSDIDKFDSLGYIEEDSDDHKEKSDETFFNFKDNQNEKILPDEINMNEINNLLNNAFGQNNNKAFGSQMTRTSNKTNKEQKPQEILERSTIKSKNELDDLFRGGSKINVKYSNLFNEVILKNEYNENKNIVLLKAEQILIILRYIYEVLHPFLIDLSDQLLIERIKYFEKDREIYISIIKQYLNIKDKTFNYILEDLMKKLNISEEIIDASFSYYIRIADKNIPIIKEINDAYDDIIHADYK